MENAGLLSVLVLAGLPAIVQAPTYKICGDLNSDITLSLAPLGIERKIKFTSPKKDVLIAKTENGKVTSILNNKYKLRDNGTKLVIENVTEDDVGIYTDDITLNEDGEVRKETFNVTICGDQDDQSSFSTSSSSVPNTQRSHRWIMKMVSLISVLILSVVVLWKCWKRSSDSSGQGDPNNEDHVNFPIQETDTEESSFINIHQGKSEFKDQEDDELRIESTGTEKIIVSSSLYEAF
ncbi:uncharacterized protein LOC120981665 isoform X3 [Bufo bufo]|uniref:uncharacterized protein LOC120981665 isoform X3 n=1 Tax=Bufo bufo TaxID=8384 RepID=UPI001ABDF326|nr:uncharacterized protein LOC120981665 isoform X3 [Bufo bufo]